jgi:transposase
MMPAKRSWAATSYSDGHRRASAVGRRPRSLYPRPRWAVLLFSQLFGLFPFISRIFADGGYAGEKLKQALRSFGNWCIEIVKRSDQAKGFVLLPRRWVVERTFAWFGRNRRLSRQFEASPETAVAYLYAASVMLLARRLARSS